MRPEGDPEAASSFRIFRAPEAEPLDDPDEWDEADLPEPPVFPWEPVGAGYQTYNVASESSDPGSILNHYKQLIQIRNQHGALRIGDMDPVTSTDPGLYAILRTSHPAGTAASVSEAVLVLINLTNAPISAYSLSIRKSPVPQGSYHVLPILGNGPAADLNVASLGDFSQYKPVDEVPAYGTLIYQLQGTGILLK